MTQKLINTGTSANKGDGDPLRLAFQKINDNFTELYTGSPIVPQDLRGSVFGDDSTLLVDAVNNTIPSSVISGTEATNWNTAYSWGDHSGAGYLTSVPAQTFASLTSTPTTIAGYGIADAYTKTEVDSAITSSVLPSGSTQSIDVVAQDSTLLVDSVNGTLNATTLTGALPAIDGSALTGVTVSSIAFADVTSTPTTIAGYGITDAFDGVFASLTSKPTTIAGYGITDAYTKTEVDSAITSSVLPSGSTQSIDIVAQDSTVLVDSVNGTLNATTLTGALPAINGSALTNVTTTFANITSTPTTISGYGITDAYTKTEVDAQISAPTGDLTGSVFGDDSTLLVDGVNNKIVGVVDTTSLRTSEISIALGLSAGLTSQGTAGVAVGNLAGTLSQGVQAVAVGQYAGYNGQGATSVAIGYQAGQTTQSPRAVAVGQEAGKTTQNTDAVAIGRSAGETNQGLGAVALGYGAGRNNQAANSIVINASGLNLENTTASSLVVKPIRNAIGTTMLMYDATSGEVTHSGSIQESFSTTNGATGVTALDCSTGNVHYLTAPAGDITANFTNLNLTAEYATNVTVVIDQGGTEYEITAVQIGGVAQTIVWQGNSAPTGTANGVDSFSFTILNDGGTYVVLGQMVAFGGV